jgi:hypothetical protein
MFKYKINMLSNLDKRFVFSACQQTTVCVIIKKIEPEYVSADAFFKAAT